MKKAASTGNLPVNLPTASAAWRLLLEIENTPVALTAAGTAIIQGGIRSDRTVALSGGALSLILETDPKNLDRLATRTAWVESFAPMKRPTAAYTLIEVLVAAAILMIAVGAAAALAMATVTQEEINSRVARCLNLHEQAVRLYQLGLDPSVASAVLPVDPAVVSLVFTTQYLPFPTSAQSSKPTRRSPSSPRLRARSARAASPQFAHPSAEPRAC